MKKSIAVLLALMLLIGTVFFGCGKDKNEEPDDNTTETTDTRKQEEVNDLEEGLSKETLVVISNEILKKGAAGNTGDTAAVRATVLNASGKTVTYAVVAFGLWDSEDKPVSVAADADGKDEYITRYSYMALKVPTGNFFGNDVLIPIADEVGEKAVYIKAIPLSCTFDDGTNWVNPHYDKFLELFDGKTYIESDKSGSSANTGEKETTSSTGAPAGDETETTKGNNNTDNQQNGGNTQNNGNGQNANNNQGNSTNTNTGEEYLINKCMDIFKSGSYKMKVVTDLGTEDESEFEMWVHDGSMKMSTSLEDIDATMLYVKSKDTTYMLFDSINMYCDVTEDMMGGDMDMSELTKEFNFSVNGKVTVSESVFNGQKVRCESIVDDTGAQSNYYFNAAGELVGRDDFYSDGTVSSMSISGFSGEVDASMFEIPKGYLYVNLSWIMAFMGEK